MSDTKSLYRSDEGHAAVMAWYRDALDRLDVDYCDLILNTSFGDTHVIVCGPADAPAVLLIHGIGGNALLWSPQMEALSKLFRVYALDVIGQTGRSAPTRPSHIGSTYAMWLVDVLDALHLEKTSIVGVSFGGRLALKLGSLVPHRIQSAILLSPIGLATIDLRRFLHVLPLALNLSRSGDKVMRQILRGFFAPPGTKPCYEVENLLALFGAHYRQEGLRATPLLFPLPKSELQCFEVPTMLLVGEFETLFNIQSALDRARRLLPDLRAIKIIPNANHILNYDQPNIVNTHILSFLKQTAYLPQESQYIEGF